MKSYTRSENMLKEASRYLAGGVSSSLRASMKPVPIYAESASCARIRDVDGNEYIDYLLAYGPLILGHAHPGLTKMVNQAMERGYTYGIQHEGEIQLAKKLTEILPCAEQVAFSGSGTEAVMLALRLSRAFTGKQKIVRFHGHYHGWSDSIFTAFPSADMKNGNAAPAIGGIVPGTDGQSDVSLNDIILLPWNDEEALEWVLKSHYREIAAVITEPVMCNSGCLLPQPGYLEEMRKLTQELGIVLIFDEVITGFRLGLGGAHGRFGIVPDLMTMGKALAGGISLSAVGGRNEIMELIESGRVSHLGTLNGNGVSIAAALATIDLLANNGGRIFEHMEALAARLSEGLRKLLKTNGIPGVVNQIGPVFHMMFVNRKEVRTFAEFTERNAELYNIFAEKMLEEGVLIRSSGLWYLSVVHQEADIDETLSAATRVLASIRTA